MSTKHNIYGSLYVNDNITGDTLTLSTVNNDNSLTQILSRDSSDGTIKYRDVSSIIGAASADTFVTGSTLSGSTLLLSRNDGVELTTDLSSILFTGNTSGDCITDLYITNLYGCSPITVNDTLNLTNNARLNINATSSFTLAVESYDNNIATFRDVDGEDIFFAQGSLANQDLVFGFGDFGDAYGYAGYTLDTVLNQHNFTNGNLYLGNVSTFNTDTKLYVDGNTKVTGSLSATTFYGDGSNLTGISTDNFFVSGGTYNSTSKEINFTGNSAQTTFDVDLTSLVSSVSGDTFVVSGNANAGTSELTFSYNTGGTFTVTNSAALFSDNDINVTGGTYNPSNGCVSFVTNSGTTFDVCGFVTGITDTNTFSTGGTVTQSATTGDTAITLQIVGNSGFTPYSITGITDTFVNDFTFSSNTFTISQNDGSSFDSSIETIELGNILSAVTFNIGTSGSISATTFNGNTFSGGTFYGDGSNLTGITDNDKFVTGFTYDNSNNLTISRNDGSGFTTNISTMSGLTVNGTLSATTLDGGTILSGGTNLTTIIESFDTYVTGGTVSISATTNTNSATIGLLYKNSEGVPHTLPFDDTFTTGATYDNGTALVTFDKNDGTSYFLNLSTIDVNDTFVSGGTYNDSTDIITFTNTSGGTFNVTGITDTFVTGGTYSSGTTSLDFSGNNGFAPFSVNVSELIDDTNTFVTGFTYNDTNTFTISNNNGDNYSASIDIMSGLTVNGESVFSGTGTDVVQIYGSGSTTPIFRVEGSAGELFSITDSLIGELFSVNNISGLPILTVNSDNTILWGNNTSPSLNTTIKKSINSGLSEIYSIPVSAYTGGFFEYTVTGAGARAGSIMSIFSGTSIDYNETTTNDIGDTSGVTFDMNISGGTANLTVSATTNSWEIKTIVRSI